MVSHHDGLAVERLAQFFDDELLRCCVLQCGICRREVPGAIHDIATEVVDRSLRGQHVERRITVEVEVCPRCGTDEAHVANFRDTMLEHVDIGPVCFFFQCLRMWPHR